MHLFYFKFLLCKLNTGSSKKFGNSSKILTPKLRKRNNFLRKYLGNYSRFVRCNCLVCMNFKHYIEGNSGKNPNRTNICSFRFWFLLFRNMEYYFLVNRRFLKTFYLTFVPYKLLISKYRVIEKDRTYLNTITPNIFEETNFFHSF